MDARAIRLGYWTVRPYYLGFMGANVLWKGDELAPHLVRAAKRLVAADLPRLHAFGWRGTAVAAWVGIAQNDHALAPELHRALRESQGSLTSPPLLVAVVELPTEDTVAAIEAYHANDVRNQWGAADAALAAAAVHAERTGETSTLPAPDAAAREEFAELLAFAARLRATPRAGLVRHWAWHSRRLWQQVSDRD